MRQSLKALVVDDEYAIRQLTVRALQQYEFTCDEASDGHEAMAMLDGRKYDVLVTDLRMPKCNGHSLAVELIGKSHDRPVVVVVTGVLEPKLATDLIARGVDDFIFKPVDFKLFGAKVRALCDRRTKERSNCAITSSPHPPDASPRNTNGAMVSIEEMESRLDGMVGKMPMSQAAIQAANNLKMGKLSVPEMSRCISADPALTVEVLRLANAADAVSTGSRIDNLDTAVMRLGHEKVVEAAQRSPTLCDAARTLPWYDFSLIWKRSIATGLAIGHLQATAKPGQDDEGLFIAAQLLPMSRVLMGLAFPDVYERLIAECRTTKCSLASAERDRLPMSAARALAGTLARWNLPPRVYKPLQQAGLSYREISSLTEPLRSKIDRLRFAELLGQLAVGRFEPWDEIDFPPPETMCRLRADNVAVLLDQVKASLAECASEADAKSSRVNVPPSAVESPEIRYFKLTVEPCDLLAAVLETARGKVTSIQRKQACQAQPSIVNCLDVSQERLAWFLEDSIPDSRRMLISRGSVPTQCESWGRLIQLPTSYLVLSDAVSAVTKHDSAV